MTLATAAEKWIEKTELILASLIQLAFLVIAVSSLLSDRWLTAFSATLVLILSLAPAFLERQLRVRLPVELTLFVCIFLFASFVLGEIGDFYEQLWWWDLLLHGSSAFVTGLLGFVTVYIFYMTRRIEIEPIYVAAISFGAAITLGTLWEIFEFLMDYYFGFSMQRSGLVDTMTDLIVNSLGALTASAIGFYYVRHDDALMGRKAIRTLVERGRKSLEHARRGKQR